LPGAISTKLVHPDLKVVGAVGDGAFLMNLQELATAARLGVAPVYVVWEDGGYGLITWKQELEFDRHFGTDFTNPDFVKVVEGFGCAARRIGAGGELREALEEAFERSDRPSVIVVPVDYSENLKLSRRLGQVIAR
jgi:acetolactate synthase-1/2/3 large subunit